MAGLGTQNQKSVAPLVRRVQLRSAYNFLCLLYAKWSTRNKNGPHGVSHSPPVIQFDGPNFLFNVTPQYKNQVKLSAATLFWPYVPNPATVFLAMQRGAKLGVCCNLTCGMAIMQRFEFTVKAININV